MYQKEILYLYLFRHGEKENCVGFLKSEQKRDGHLVVLQVKNILDNITGTFPVRIRSNSGWQEVGQVQLQQGHGNWQQKGMGYFTEVEIPLSDEYKIRGRSKEQNNNQVTEQVDDPSERQNTGQDGILLKSPNTESEDGLNMSRSTVRTDTQNQEQNNVQVVSQEPEPKLKAVSEAYPILWEDKWEQLLHSYDQIHPYGDERTYIKLEPKDFTVLRSGYQHLVNNSFLLHGFYNYRYLILGKEKDFYIGVPGVFYEREKMVAMMFGFEAFECEGGTAEEGKFGYYLRKVEL